VRFEIKLLGVTLKAVYPDVAVTLAIRPVTGTSARGRPEVGFRNSVSRATRPKKFEGQRVLLVEDTRLYSFAVRSLLEANFGLIVIHCATFAALRHELDSDTRGFSLAILDLCLADAANGEALDLVQARAIPSIVFSGFTSERRREEIMSKDVVDIVYKNSPSSLESLGSSVDRVLSLSRPQLLLVDPQGENDSAMVAALASCSFTVDVCTSTTDALSILDASQNTELVVVRSDLAEKDSYCFLELLKTRFGDDAVRVIGFSQNKGRDDVARFLGAGGDDFVHLPTSPADVESRLVHTLTIHKQIQSLQRMASRDYLTDLLNRRYFFDRGPKLVDICLRQQAPVCAALLDIDHFKRLNDTHGHEIGDLVLKAVSRKILALVGEKQHLPARIGGEEFAILFTNLDIEQAYEFCERIRMEIAAIRVVVDDEDLSVTISMGLASISDAETFDNYLNAADQYLYLAKHSGRNRVFSDYQVARIAAS
jgi:diguanylate cyclase (GGDEF)-like protein